MKCKTCGKPVRVDAKGVITRACEHKDAPIVAEVSATAKGLGKLK